MRNFAKFFRVSRLLRNMPFYAVAKGNRVGIYATWDECKAQVDGHSGAKFKKFKTKDEAEAFLSSHGVGPPKQQVLLEKSAKNETTEKIPFVDFWPDDISDGEEDDYLLAAVAAKLDPERPLSVAPIVTPAQNSRKRKAFEPQYKEGLIDMLKRIGKKSKVYKVVGHKDYGEHKFPVDFEGFVLAYTDGACERNGRHDAVAGLGVYFDENHPLNSSKPVTGRATNNAGEIQAACEAIRIAQKCNIDKLCINTDSQFLINSVTIWMKSWKKKNWTLSDGNPIKNLQDYTTLDKLITDSDLQIKWNYVKGHAGIRGNEGADRLAKLGALMYDRSKNSRKR